MEMCLMIDFPEIWDNEKHSRTNTVVPTNLESLQLVSDNL